MSLPLKSTPPPNAYTMPKPGAVVSWRNAPDVPPVYAIVTSVGKHALAVMLFPPESRVGIPKEAVRFVSDPWNDLHGINADSGIWDYTDEQKLLARLSADVAELVSDAHIAKKR